MATILQMTFWKAFSCVKSFVSKFVPGDPINDKSQLVQVMAWRWTGNKPFPEPMTTKFYDTLWHDWCQIGIKPLSKPMMSQNSIPQMAKTHKRTATVLCTSWHFYRWWFGARWHQVICCKYFFHVISVDHYHCCHHKGTPYREGCLYLPTHWHV